MSLELIANLSYKLTQSPADGISGHSGAFARGGTAWYSNLQNILSEYGANTPAFGSNGLWVDGAGTQYFVNPDLPVTQNINLPMGDFCLWVTGGVSATLTADTATISSGGIATDGSPITFSVTGAGTVDVTISGSPTWCQLEAGDYPSSHIYNDGTPGDGSTTLRSTQAGYPKYTIALMDADVAAALGGDGADTGSEVFDTLPTSYDFLVSGNDGRWRVYNDPTILETDAFGAITCTVGSNSDGLQYYATGQLEANTAYRLTFDLECTDLTSNETMQVYMGQFSDVALLRSSKWSGGATVPNFRDTGSHYHEFLTGADVNGGFYFRSYSYVDGFTFKISNLKLEPIQASSSALIRYTPKFDSTDIDSTYRKLLSTGDLEISVNDTNLAVTDGTNTATVAHSGFSADDELWLFVQANASTGKLRAGIVGDSSITWGTEADYTGSFNPGSTIAVHDNEEYGIMGGWWMYEGIADNDGQIIDIKNIIDLQGVYVKSDLVELSNPEIDYVTLSDVTI